ncbi:MAG: D-2-hydroxyacid dehydrogenase [Stappiaceae bacterium]
MTLQAFISTPLEQAQVDRIRAAFKGRVNVIHEPDLLPPQRYTADHKGEDGYKRTGAQNDRWLAHLAKADFLWDIPPLSMLPSHDLSWFPNLKWVQTTSSGVGNLIEALNFESSNIVVTTAKGIHAVPLSEFAMMVILNHIKRHSYLQAEQVNHRWQRYCGESLVGKTVAIIGAGEVGHRVAARCKDFGMNIAAMSRSLTKTGGERLGYDRVFRREDMADVFAESDVVVLCIPHTPETEKIIDRTLLKAMKPGCVLINIARGQVVDEEAMIDELKSKHLGFAALDVATVEPLPAESPLWTLPNVLISPHSASTVSHENELIADLFIHNLDCMLNGSHDQMKNRFNFLRGY